ncbi:hypothetical protein FNV43_RR25412 [Rhamnella rubrinervis]|uniref:LRAT domain-containing protein n=1 Tax=Rhamnella rubrinervis TaxID=2594499 RepID=A0A8K0DU50_9ROSA|nr:hypothetical protein FNV43_RR25412 [Rhamnella rubrinervis]
MVIHLTRGPGYIINSSTRSKPSHDRVVRCDIQDFLCDGQLYRFEYGVNKIVFLIKRPGTCSLASSTPPADVLRRASFLLENGFGDYNLFDKNCEDFAIYCKTGLIKVDESASGRSGQIASLLAAFSSAAMTPYHLLPSSFIVVPLMVCSFYCTGRLILDVETQSGCAAVEVEKLQHLNNAHNEQENMTEESTGRSLSVEQFFRYIIWAIGFWYGTPKWAILLWFKSLILDITILFFISDLLRLHGFKLGRYSAYMIWVLGYWAFLVCFIIHSAAIFMGLDYRDYAYRITGITFL